MRCYVELSRLCTDTSACPAAPHVALSCLLPQPKGKFGTGADTLLVATGIIQVQVTGGDRYKLAQPVVMAITGGAGALAGVEGSITFDQEGKATFDITLPKQKPEKTNKLDKDE
jgi:hypothetical protein